MSDLDGAAAWATIIAGVVALGGVVGAAFRAIRSSQNRNTAVSLADARGTLHTRPRTASSSPQRLMQQDGISLMAPRYSSMPGVTLAPTSTDDWLTILRRRFICPAEVEHDEWHTPGLVKRVRGRDNRGVILEVTVDGELAIVPARAVRALDHLSANARLLNQYRHFSEQANAATEDDRDR